MKFPTFIVLVPLFIWPTHGMAEGQACKQQAYEFLTNGHGIIEEHGLGALKQIEALLKETSRAIQGEGELRTLLFKGASVTVFQSGKEKHSKIFLVDVIVDSSTWPIKSKLTIGAKREEVEEVLCKASSLGQPVKKDSWSYADGLAEVIITFDKHGRIQSIKWHYDQN